MMFKIKDAAEVEAGRICRGDWKGSSSGQAARAVISSDDKIPDRIETAKNCTVRVKGGHGGSRVCCKLRQEAPSALGVG